MIGWLSSHWEHRIVQWRKQAPMEVVLVSDGDMWPIGHYEDLDSKISFIKLCANPVM